jgi:ankyrin repeat protein
MNDPGWKALAGRKLASNPTVADLWAPRLMLILSLLPLVACAAMWLAVWHIISHPEGGFGGLAQGLALLGLAQWIMLLSTLGAVFALVGLLWVAVVRRRLGTLLALLLLLNLAAGPMPAIYSYVRGYYAANPPLVRAVKSGSMDRVQSVLSTHDITVEPDQEGYMALRTAVKQGRMNIINALVAAYAKSNKKVGLAVTYENALTLASADNNAELVEQLLQAGADPNSPAPGGSMSAASLAVRNDNRRILHMLLDAGAKGVPRAERPRPLSDALSAAVGNVDVELVKLLLSHDSQRTFKRDPEYGSELLGTAAFRNSVELTKLLLNAGADPTAGRLGNWQPLQWAVHSHNPEIVRLLLEHGADPNDSRIRYNSDPHPTRLLEIAERDAKQLENWKIVELLRSHGAN